jgi:hypothetical protein
LGNVTSRRQLFFGALGAIFCRLEGMSMKYHVTGVNHDTGARMTLDFEASSKADAERKAVKAGMDVQHAHEIHEDDAHPQAHATHRGEDAGETGALIKLIVILALLALAVYFLWGKIRPFLKL